MDYILILSFIAFNYHMIFETTIYNNKLLLAVVLFIYGFILAQTDTALSEKKRINTSDKRWVEVKHSIN